MFVNRGVELFANFRIFGISFQVGVIVECPVAQCHILHNVKNLLAGVRFPMRCAERGINRRSPVMQVNVRELRFGLMVAMHFANDQVSARFQHASHFRQRLR